MVFGLGRLEKDVGVVGHTDTGPIIEITFKRKARDGCGDELQEFVQQVRARSDFTEVAPI